MAASGKKEVASLISAAQGVLWRVMGRAAIEYAELSPVVTPRGLSRARAEIERIASRRDWRIW